MGRLPKYFRIGTGESAPATRGDAVSMQHAVQPRFASSTATITIMGGSLVAGTAFTASHHAYYSRLDDQIVGSPARQQWSIRFGTAFAFLVQVCLANTAGIACVQWVWRRCRQQSVPISAIDAAFAVDRNMFMLLDLGFVSRFPIAAGLAVFFWCFPLSSIITPATLSVEPKPTTNISIVPVGRPAINSYDQDTNTIFSPRSADSSKLSQLFNILAFTGERLPLKGPGNLQNTSYEIDIIVPSIRCNESDEDIRSWTATAAYKNALAGLDDNLNSNDTIFHYQNLTFTSNDTALKGQIGYYAAPSYEILRIMNKIPNGTFAIMDELWIAMGHSEEGKERLGYPEPTESYYYRCVIRNASMTTTVTFTGNTQTLQASNIRETEYVADSGDIEGDDDSVLYAQENYASFGSVLFQLLSGFVLDWETPGSCCGWNWSTKVDQTILGTARDFSVITQYWKDGGLELGATVQDKNMTTLIEEFALNASWSLMAVPSFSKSEPTRVNQTLWFNKYTYHPRNLFIAYGCSIFASTVAAVAGVYAIYANGKSYDNHFSTISNATQSPDVAALFANSSSGTQSSKQRISSAKIQLHKDGGVERFRTDTEHVALGAL